MSCKSAIYAINTTDGTSIAANGIYAPAQVVRRYGPSCQLVGNGIQISGAGYYSINAIATFDVATAGTVNVMFYQDGTPIPGAISTVETTAANQTISVPVEALARVYNNYTSSIITVVIDTAVTGSNLAIKVEKE